MDDDRRTESRWRYVDFVIYRAESVRGEGHLANVSEGGVFVRTERFPESGEQVEILLQSSTSPLALHGQVCWVGRRQDGAEGFGAQLVNPPQEYLDLVQSLELRRRTSGPERSAPRIVLSLPVAVEFGTSCDDGTLCDLSLSGARLENTGVRPTVGSQVTLLFSLEGYKKPFEIVARVVRTTDTGGYAVHFEALDPRLKDALGDASDALRRLPDSSG